MESQASRSGSSLHVLVADSNQIQSNLLINALRRQPGLSVRGCRAELFSCLESIPIRPVDVLLVSEGTLENGNHLSEIVRTVHSSYPKLAIVLLLNSYDRDSVVELLRAGARGLFCNSSLSFKALCKCIRVVHQGQLWANTEQLTYVMEALRNPPPVNLIGARGEPLLTARENQIVSLVSEGLSNREVATGLKVSENTIKKALLRIFEKLGMSNRVELVLYALAQREQPKVNLGGTIPIRPAPITQNSAA